MANFPNQQLTHGGWDALSEALAGKRLVFVRMAVGDGEIAADSDILEMTDLAHHVRNITITGYRAEGEGRITITGVLRSAEVEEGFYLREVGIFCRLDNAGEEILYSLNNSGDQADYIPDKNEGTVVIQAIEVQVLIGRAANVEVLVIIGEAGLEGGNLGETGAGVFAGREGNRFNFKRLIGDPPSAVIETAESITIRAADEPVIWNVRLRSFNAIGNPNFEVDQRNPNSPLSNPPAGTMVLDRWRVSRGGLATAAINARTNAENINVPGTNFCISRNYARLTLATAQASLAASDNYMFVHNVEGPLLRELINDVHSVSLLVRSSVAGQTFALGLRDSPITRSLVKLCTIPTANVWTLIQLPNLPVWPAANFRVSPNVEGYLLAICLASGSDFIAPPSDTWQSGNFIGVSGMSNFAASPVGSTFDIAFVQHEPGPQCTTLIDKPFHQNLDECLRYYDKSYGYNTLPGTPAGSPVVATWFSVGQFSYGWMPFKKELARQPTTTIFNHATGAANSVQDSTAVNRAVTNALNVGLSGYAGINFGGGATIPANIWIFHHYVADTNW